MPELPEVETVRRGLAPVLEGRTLTKVVLRRPDLRFPLPPHFAESLEGARVETLARRAKYLVAELDTGVRWIAHLGMTGRFSVIGANTAQPGAFYYAAPPDPAHTHIIIETDAGIRLEYNDPRRFGYMDALPPGAFDAHPFFKDLGPEPLSPAFNAAQLAAALKGKKTPIKAALLDQRVVAGLGNIYVCEALFRAGVSPKRPAGRVAPARLAGLVDAIRAVLEEAIEAGGSSLRDYAAADGALGYFQHRFSVYDRAGTPCPRPGCAGAVRRIPQGGRSSFYCPACQR
ncbi:MAG: bifunctional DNA-formamidopyrimidine glycosylase/DNA-(apurinic or apyrimidinic site) lyase [Alphaproteobacteria bacterium]|nr:bifunctional DNA-formamidopyrimidine glycosylase/DNA-(apurinic or apyrimidinic site) lyase [Alphaproteobacteria bacterium]